MGSKDGGGSMADVALNGTCSVFVSWISALQDMIKILPLFIVTYSASVLILVLVQTNFEWPE